MPFTISGNAGAAGVTVAATGAGTGSATSAADGTYTISGLGAGSYTITPTLTGATFTPASRPETITAANLTGVNFVAQAASYSPTTVATDNFTRANEQPLNPAHWTTTTDVNDSLAVVSNKCASGSPAMQGQEVYNGVAFAANQNAAVTIAAFGTSSEVDVFVRANVANTLGYALSILGSGSGTYQFDLLDVGANAFIGVSITTSVAPIAGDIASIQAVGNLITVFYNGTPLISATSITSAGGSPGIAIVSSGVQTDTELSLFTAGNVPSTNPPQIAKMGTSTVGGGFVTEIDSSRTQSFGTRFGTKIL